MEKPKPQIQDFSDFIQNLKRDKSELIRKRGFMYEHGFIKEQEFINDKVKIIDEILYKLEMVVDGDMKGNQITFTF